MSFYYSGDPASSDKDTVRFLTGQTEEKSSLVSDEEILYALTQEGNVFLASALVLDALNLSETLAFGVLGVSAILISYLIKRRSTVTSSAPLLYIYN